MAALTCVCNILLRRACHTVYLMVLQMCTILEVKTLVKCMTNSVHYLVQTGSYLCVKAVVGSSLHFLFTLSHQTCVHHVASVPVMLLLCNIIVMIQYYEHLSCQFGDGLPQSCKSRRNHLSDQHASSSTV